MIFVVWAFLVQPKQLSFKKTLLLQNTFSSKLMYKNAFVHRTLNIKNLRHWKNYINTSLIYKLAVPLLRFVMTSLPVYQWHVQQGISARAQSFSYRAHVRLQRESWRTLSLAAPLPFKMRKLKKSIKKYTQRKHVNIAETPIYRKRNWTFVRDVVYEKVTWPFTVCMDRTFGNGMYIKSYLAWWPKCR